MLLENIFEVPAAPDRVWAYLLDVEQVAPCMPGAELTEVVDDRNWKGKVTVKLGPVGLNYAGKVVMTDRDNDAHRVVLEATGQETRGKGTAKATVTAELEPAGAGTRVQLATDMTLSGAAAQFGRGMVQDVSKRLTDQFADCVQQRLSSDPGDVNAGDEAGATAADATSSTVGATSAAATATPAARPATRGGGRGGATARTPVARAKPVAGIRLALWTLWRALVRGVRSLFARRSRRR